MNLDDVDRYSILYGLAALYLPSPTTPVKGGSLVPLIDDSFSLNEL
jgi:hypothetical protein